MENKVLKQICKMQDLMHAKVEAIIDHIQDGRCDCAIVELNALNEYLNLQSGNIVYAFPNDML